MPPKKKRNSGTNTQFNSENQPSQKKVATHTNGGDGSDEWAQNNPTGFTSPKPVAHHQPPVPGQTQIKFGKAYGKKAGSTEWKALGPAPAIPETRERKQVKLPGMVDGDTLAKTHWSERTQEKLALKAQTNYETNPGKGAPPWSDDDISNLRAAVKSIGTSKHQSWEQIARVVGTVHTAEACRRRWYDIKRCDLTLRRKKQVGRPAFVKQIDSDRIEAMQARCKSLEGQLRRLGAQTSADAIESGHGGLTEEEQAAFELLQGQIQICWLQSSRSRETQRSVTSRST
jgi:hypothetical protein